jgi:putative SOS response-associated peptidase YedK
MINARAEGIAEKPTYKRALSRRRCIIPADGFYEWQAVGPPKTPKGRPAKQPMFIHRCDGEPMAFAGLWEVWKLPDGMDGIDGVDDEGWLRSTVIVTTKANELLLPLHDRMPVMLPESAWGRWLDPAQRDAAAVEELLVPAPDDELEFWPVSSLVSKADNNGPELVAPLS